VEATRLVVLSLLDEAHAAAERLANPADAEALHDFRVAIRRLRSTARAWKRALAPAISRKHRKALEAIQEATGRGRDAEVALAWLAEQREDLASAHRKGLEWLVARLGEDQGEAGQEATAGARELFAALEGRLRGRLEVVELEVRLEPTGPGTYAEALASQARDHVNDLLAHLARVGGASDVEEAHASRIRGKRLRYLVEPVAGTLPEADRLVSILKRLQDVLGDLHDAHVLHAELGRAMEAFASGQARRIHRMLAAPDAQERIRREMRRTERSGLIALTQRVQARAERLFGRLEKGWLSDGAAQLVEAAERLAERLDRVVGASVEIERKFLLSGRPDLPDAPSQEIEQGYLPGGEIRERLRRVRDRGEVRHLRTIKLGQGIARTEMEEPLEEDVFAALWPLTEGARVAKRRHLVPEGDLVWEVDEFLDRGLWMAEVELHRPDEEVSVPPWLAPFVVRDVTDEREYTNLALAR
jgi:CHAD domain-containing protein/CYTH domain-containing protein